eukprot:TRINITY_DN3824_c0_g3_i1.p1 TRINITY_DN3824_c0_g3~~TRINITY_DN3824_c0_g3_i1.p1  ORF type:complete len:395 (-),score=58.06 TRINITY_DN3824_c0_g3_i1:84-1211(-)
MGKGGGKGGKSGKAEDEGFAIPPRLVAEVQAYSSCYLKLLVDDLAAGLFIGKKGHTKKDIERQSGARTVVSGPRLYYPGTDKRVIVLAAPTLDELYIAIDHTIHQCSKGAAYESRDAGADDDGNCTLWIVLPERLCGKVLGKGGSQIKQITEQTGIRPAISTPADSTVPNERLAAIQGGHDAVLACVKAIAALVSVEYVMAEHMVTECDLEDFGEVAPAAAVEPMEDVKSKWQPWRSNHVPEAESGWDPPPPPAKKQRQAEDAGSVVGPPQRVPTPPSTAPTRRGGAGALPRGKDYTISFEISKLYAGSMIGSFFKSVNEATGVKPKLSGLGSTNASGNCTVTLTGQLSSVHQAHIMVIERAEEVELELKDDYEA